MRLTERERADRRAAFRRMTLPEKAEFIFAYYKLPLVLLLLALVAVSTVLYHAVTGKEAVLYLGCANVSLGDDLTLELTEDYLAFAGLDPRRQEIYVYSALYLSDDPAPENHEYAYASKLKVMASVNSRQLDAVLMNRESYDLLSRDGYLLSLGPALDADPVLRERLIPYLTENDVVLADNALEYRLGETESYEETVESAVNALQVSDMPRFAAASFSGAVYLGVIANSPRLPAVLDYLSYLVSP